jgi:ketosteroid isomerase-like protein
MDEHENREALNRHWAASDANDFDVEHDIYRDDAVLEYPQSGERIRGRHNIQASRVAQPSSKRFTVRRIVGTGDLWVTEFILAYDGRHGVRRWQGGPRDPILCRPVRARTFARAMGRAHGMKIA